MRDKTTNILVLVSIALNLGTLAAVVWIAMRGRLEWVVMRSWTGKPYAVFLYLWDQNHHEATPIIRLRWRSCLDDCR